VEIATVLIRLMALQLQVASGEVGSILGAEFGEQRGDVTLDGPHRYVQLVGDGGVRQPDGDEGEGIGFAARDTELSKGVGNRGS
jgi:hypothetical protein